MNSVLSGGAFGQDNDEANNATPGKDGHETYKRPDTGSLEYQPSIAAACGVNCTTCILAFKPAAPESSRPIDLRSLDNLVDNYYLNLLNWSINNQVAVGLERSIYVWNADTCSRDRKTSKSV